MKNLIATVKILAVISVMSLILSGCLITEVDQTTEVAPNGIFTSTITVTDMTADANPHEGAVAVLVPDDWTFASGTYDSDVGVGNLILDPNEEPLYGNLDSVLVPPDGMKWVRLISDSAYTNDANVTHEVTVNFIVGEKTGAFPIGYMVTKNTSNMLGSLNQAEVDNENAWADTSMNHIVTIGVTDVHDNYLVRKYSLEQNYPNPFNPATTISFTLLKQEHAKLTVYDALGKEITTIVNSVLPAGLNIFTFDAENLSSGIYIYKLETESFVQARKMVVLK
jgi:hypothetical protein